MDVAEGKQVFLLSLRVCLGAATVVVSGMEVVFLFQELPS